MSLAAPFLLDPFDGPQLRAVISKLAAHGYSENSVTKRLALNDLSDLQWRAVPMYRLGRLEVRDPLALAIDLFLLQGSLTPGESEQLFSPDERDLLIGAGLCAVDDDCAMRARASLFPVGDRLIFADHAWPELPHPGYAVVPSDHVMAIGRDSRNLARCTTRRPFRHALDLCTGSGIQALLACRHAEQVLAVDINPRAAHCTRFNGEVSGLSNLEVAIGDLFQPVGDTKFDLITANPPFVPSPLDTVQFRDGGRSGEDIQKRVVAGLPKHLAPGGMAQMVTELGERDGEPLVQRLREWLDGAAMDIHILRLGEHTVANYAIGHAKGDTYHEFLSSIQQWTSNLRTQGYARIVSVVISLQWSDAMCGSAWECVHESPIINRAHRAAADIGAEIEAVFQAERLTRRCGWQQTIKDGSLRRAGPIALLDARVLGTSMRAKAKATLLGRGLRVEHSINMLERQLLGRMEKKRCVPFAELIQTFRDLNVDEPSVIAAARSLVRNQLVQLER